MESKGLRIRVARQSDAASVLKIYAPYITDTVVTFEYEVPALAEFEQRMATIQRDLPWFVCEAGTDAGAAADATGEAGGSTSGAEPGSGAGATEGTVVGYAYASHFRERKAYDWSVDLSVYVDSDWHGQGIGKALYECLIATLKLQGYYNAYGGITMPNEKSVRLHEKFGFREVANYEHVGFKHGRWLDVKWYGLALAPTSEPATIGAAVEHPRPPRPFSEVEDLTRRSQI